MVIFNVVMVFVILFVDFIFGFVIYKIYGNYVKKKRDAGIVSLTTLRPIGLSMYCFLLFSRALNIIWLPLTNLSSNLLTHSGSGLNVITCIFAVADGIIVWGLWRLKGWSYLAALVSIVIYCGYDVFKAIDYWHRSPFSSSYIVGIIIHVVAFLYLLLNPRVKRAFSSKESLKLSGM